MRKKDDEQQRAFHRKHGYIATNYQLQALMRERDERIEALEAALAQAEFILRHSTLAAQPTVAEAIEKARSVLSGEGES